MCSNVMNPQNRFKESLLCFVLININFNPCEIKLTAMMFKSLEYLIVQLRTGAALSPSSPGDVNTNVTLLQAKETLTIILIFMYQYNFKSKSLPKLLNKYLKIINFRWGTNVS